MAKKYSQTSNTRFDDPVAIKREFELRMKDNIDLSNRIEKIEGNFPIQFPKQQEFKQELTSIDKSINIRDNKDLSLWNYSATMHKIKTTVAIYQELVNRNPLIMTYPDNPLFTPTSIYDGWIPFGCYTGDEPGITTKTIKENYNKNWLRYTTNEKIYEYVVSPPPVWTPPPSNTPLQKRFLFFHPCPTNVEGAVYDINAKVTLKITTPVPLNPHQYDHIYIAGMLIIDRLSIDTGLIETTVDPFAINYNFYNPAIKRNLLGVETTNVNGYAILSHIAELRPVFVMETQTGTPPFDTIELKTRITLNGTSSIYLKSNKDIMTVWYKLYVIPMRNELDSTGWFQITRPDPIAMSSPAGIPPGTAFQLAIEDITERLDIQYSFRNQYLSNPIGSGGDPEFTGGNLKLFEIIRTF